jgi:MFS family permease
MIADLGNCTQAEWIEWNRTRVPMDNDFTLNSSNSGDDEHCNTWTSGDVAIVIGAAKIGAVVGTLISGFMMDIGRRTTVGINCAFFSVGPIIMAVSEGVPGLILGRFIVGLGVGVGSVVSPIYMAEMSPPAVRGRVVMLYVVFLAIGACVRARGAR